MNWPIIGISHILPITWNSYLFFFSAQTIFPDNRRFYTVDRNDCCFHCLCTVVLFSNSSKGITMITKVLYMHDTSNRTYNWFWFLFRDIKLNTLHLNCGDIVTSLIVGWFPYWQNSSFIFNKRYFDCINLKMAQLSKQIWLNLKTKA